MNWGIIGLGHMGKQFANSIKEVEKSSLIGISSKSFFKLIKFGIKYNVKIKHLFKNYEKILLCKEIDNIYIGTLNNTHHDLIEKCIEAKKNILCEKPFVVNFDQAKNIKNKLKNSKILFLEAIAYRSHPQIKNVINLIKSNTIGNVIKINSSFGFNAGLPKNNSRLFSKKLGGGSILDLGCYPVSISNLIANISLNPKNNIPVLRNVNGKIYNSEIDLNAQAELVYENGVRSEISVSINENLNNTTTIFGSTGKLIILNPWLPGKESIVEIHKNNQIEKIKTKSDLSVFASQIDCFNKNIEKRNLECDYPSMSIDNSVDCMQIITDWKNKIFENENKKFKK